MLRGPRNQLTGALMLFICKSKPKLDLAMALEPDCPVSDSQEKLPSESSVRNGPEFTPHPLKSHVTRATTVSSTGFKDAAWAHGGTVRYKGGS